MSTTRNFYCGYTAPESPAPGDQWIDENVNSIKVYIRGYWQELATIQDVMIQTEELMSNRLYGSLTPSDVLLNGRSVAERLDAIEQSLGILPRTPSLEKKYPHLEELHNLHVDAIIEVVDMLSTIKSNYIKEVEKLRTFEALADEDIA